MNKITTSPAYKVFVYQKPIHFNCSHNAVKKYIDKEIDQECFYVFFNSRKDRIKIFFYDETGSTLIYKIIDKEFFDFEKKVLNKQIYFVLASIRNTCKMIE